MPLRAFVVAHLGCRAFRSSDPEPEHLSRGLARFTVTCTRCEASLVLTLPLAEWLDIMRELIAEGSAEVAMEAAKRLNRLPPG